MSGLEIAATVFMFLVFFGAILGVVLYVVFGRTPRYPYRHRCIVNLKNQGSTFRGILWEQRGGWLVLKHAELLKDRSAPVPVDGDVLIDRREVEFIQVPPGVPEP